MPQQQIVGIQRTLQSNTNGQTWNNKKIRWSIAHNFNNISKPYDIELQMVLISSKRIVKVNQQVKDIQMCSFGYESKFDISDKLKGHIKQDSLTFELFINGRSFTLLQEKSNAYQPPKLDIGGNNTFWENGTKNGSLSNQRNETKIIILKQLEQPVVNKTSVINNPLQPQKKKTHSHLGKPKSTEFETQQLKQPALQFKQKQFSLVETVQEKKHTESTIKDAQSELMKILMEEKRKKKEKEQQLKISQMQG